MKSLLLSAIMTFALATTGCALQTGAGGGSPCGCNQPVSDCTALSGDCGCSAPRGLTPSCPLLTRMSDSRGMGLRVNQKGTACNQGRGSGLFSRIANRGTGSAAGCSSCADTGCGCSAPAVQASAGCGCASAGDAGCGCGGNAASSDCGCSAPAPARAVVRRLGDNIGQGALVSRVTSRLSAPAMGCNSCEAAATDCGCGAPAAATDCGCDAPAADCGCDAPAARVGGGLLSRIGSRGCGCGDSGATDCGCDETVVEADCGCDSTSEQAVGGLLGKIGANGCGCKLGNCKLGSCLFGGRAKAAAGGAVIGNGLQGFRGCGAPGCGAGGRPCGGCLAKLRGAGQHPYGGAIPHTAQGPGNGTGAAPSYAYPYYTTRGPRDFLSKNPPSIGY